MTARAIVLRCGCVVGGARCAGAACERAIPGVRACGCAAYADGALGICADARACVMRAAPGSLPVPPLPPHDPGFLDWLIARRERAERADREMAPQESNAR